MIQRLAGDHLQTLVRPLLRRPDRWYVAARMAQTLPIPTAPAHVRPARGQSLTIQAVPMHAAVPPAAAGAADAPRLQPRPPRTHVSAAMAPMSLPASAPAAAFLSRPPRQEQTTQAAHIPSSMEVSEHVLLQASVRTTGRVDGTRPDRRLILQHIVITKTLQRKAAIPIQVATTQDMFWELTHSKHAQPNMTTEQKGPCLASIQLSARRPSPPIP